MLAKLLLAIAVLGATGCGLLAVRQQRLVAARSMILAHDRLLALRQADWELGRRIAASCRPETVRQMLAELGGEWAPIPAEVPAAGPTPRPQVSPDGPVQ